MRRISSGRSAGAIALIALIALLGTTAAQALTDQRPAGRFDDRIKVRERGSFGVAPVSTDSLGANDTSRTGWEDFRNRVGGRWKVYLDERTGMPTLVSGSGIRWFEEGEVNGLASLEAAARRFLEAEKALLGDWTEVLTLVEEASGRMRNGYWKLVFGQQVDGIRVEDARFEFHVIQGRLAMFGTSNWAMPRTGGMPVLDAVQARAVLNEYLGADTASFPRDGEPELVVLVLDADPALEAETGWAGARGEGLDHALVWRIQFRVPGEPALWTGEVDALDGIVVAFYDGAHYEAIRGGVFPISNDEDCTDAGCEIRGFPMPFADYTEDGQPETFSDAYGNLACGVPGASLETNLSGPYIHVDDACGATSEFGTCEAGIDLGLKHGENCDVQPGASPGNSPAGRSCYYHLNRAAELARFYDPANTWLQNPVTVNVNLNGTCNAWWDGEINMNGSGGGCGNTGEMQGVTVHEWGHGYDEYDGGGFDGPSEAYADVVAIFAARDSCMSRGHYTDGRTCSGYGDTCLTCTGIRDLDWAARQNNTPVTVSNFVMVNCPSGGFRSPCNMEDHCEGYLVGETMYDLATRDLPAAGLDAATSWQLAERLWYVSRPGSGGNMYACLHGYVNSCGSTSLYNKLRAADDDDGDLSNGTPHAEAIFNAFDRHDFACGSAGDPENQSTSGCPSLATPVLTLNEIAGGTELTWGSISGADEYRVYRGELGCNRQQIPVATLGAGTTSWLDAEADPDLPRYYRIEAFDANTACHSAVSNCESTPSGGRLQRSGYRLIESEPSPDGIPEPGETVQMAVTLFNSGLDTATAVTGQLRFVDPGQGTVNDADATWAGIAPSTKMESDDPHFEFTVDPGTSCSDVLEFELDTQAANAGLRTERLAVPMDDPPPSDPVSGLKLDKVVNGAALDLFLDWWPVLNAKGYRVLQSESAEFSDPAETGTTEGETELTVPDGANTPAPLTFYQVRGTNACGEEGP